MKTCNCEGCCSYKIFGGSLCECSYMGYCDYQAPKDSRPLQPLSPLPLPDYPPLTPYAPTCTCDKQSTIACPLHFPNG